MQGASMSDSKSRRKYLINLKFQIKWTLIITLTGTISAGVFAAALWYSIDQQVSLMEESVKADESLKTESQDLMVLLANMPDRTEEERQRYAKRFDEIDIQFEASKNTKARLISGAKRVRIYVLVFVALITACLFVLGIFLTHKIAGPLYVIRRNIEKLEAEGKVTARPLRKGDEFQEEYAAIRTALNNLYCYSSEEEPEKKKS